MRYELEGKTALVTGASRGLGEQISLQLLEKGVFVIGTSRSGPPESFEPYLRNRQADYLSADLANDWKRVAKEVYNQRGGWEILVNNAGALSVDYFPRLSEEKIVHEMNLDLVVPMSLHHHWLKLYKDRFSQVKRVKTPELSLNICSISSFYAWPGGTEYQTAKTGLAAFIWGLRAMQRNLTGSTDKIVKREMGALTKSQTRFLAIYPDSINTGMISKAEESSLYKVSGDLLPEDLVVEVIMKAVEGKGDCGKYDDIGILVNPTDPKSEKQLEGVYLAFIPTYGETQRPEYSMRILRKIAGKSRLVKR